MTEAARLLNLRDVAPSPWKNGKGTTRELLRLDLPSPGDAFALRVSVAEVNSDAEFSAYPGVDRILTVLRGGGIRLIDRADGTALHTLKEKFSPCAFDGERPLEGQLLDGPILDFNVMTQRAAGSARLHVVEDAQIAASANCAFIFAAAGHVEVTFADGKTSYLREWDYLKKSTATRVVAGPGSAAILVDYFSF